MVLVDAECAEEAGEHLEVEVLLEVALAFFENLFFGHLRHDDRILALVFEHLGQSLQQASAAIRLPWDHATCLLGRLRLHS